MSTPTWNIADVICKHAKSAVTYANLSALYANVRGKLVNSTYPGRKTIIIIQNNNTIPKFKPGVQNFHRHPL